MGKSHLLAAAAGAVAASALAGGVAWATIPGDGGVIQGCYTKVGGILRVVDAEKGSTASASKCRSTGTRGSEGRPGSKRDERSAGCKPDRLPASAGRFELPGRWR